MRKQAEILYFNLTIIAFAIFLSCTKTETTITVAAPTLSTSSPKDITTTGAKIGGKIISDGNSKITSRGICWGTSPIPTIDSNKLNDVSSTDSFLVHLSGLKAGTQYYVRAFAINNVAVSYGNQVSFTTIGHAPEATTGNAIDITSGSAKLTGKVTPFQLPTMITFEYGSNSTYGSVVTAIQTPLTNGANVEVTGQIAGLAQNKTYHFRVKAENSLGITYGEDRTFKTAEPDGTIGSVTDIEGNTYKTIVIGTQTWMAENLKTKKYNDGSVIPNVTDGVQWASLSTPAYCWYANDEATNKQKHGALYNWFAVNTGKLAPSGWHVPTQAEWTILINYLGGEALAGGKMKETGTLHWYSPNTGATNSSGFTALASGARFNSAGGFHSLLERGMWWTATSSGTAEYAFYHYLDNGSARIDNSFANLNFKVDGFSVRCIKD